MRDRQQLISYAGTALSALLVAFPAVVMYTILFRTAFNVPMMDDYAAILSAKANLNRL